jgi:hypothetical protein
VDQFNGKTAYHKGKKVQVDLNQVVKMWPTPHGFSPDGKSNGPSGNELGPAVNRAMWISGQLANEIGGSLNPTWTSVLMGYPPNWTEIE